MACITAPGSGIAGKGAGGEGVNQEKREFHGGCR
jgi:hypothetical protein